MKAFLPVKCNDHVSIPQSLADNIKIPFVNNGITDVGGLRDRDYIMLVRQPVLYNGGMQPFKVNVTKPHYIEMGDRKVDVNRSMKIPLTSCRSYGADFDGDEESAFPVISRAAVRECDIFKWNHSVRS